MCLRSLTKQLNLLTSFLNDEYGGGGNLNIVATDINWNSNNDACIHIIFFSTSFVCLDEFTDFMQRYENFRKSVEEV